MAASHQRLKGLERFAGRGQALHLRRELPASCLGPRTTGLHLPQPPVQIGQLRLLSHELMTAEQLLDVSIPGKQVELVRGRLVVKEPRGYLHATVVARLAAELVNYARAQNLGQVVAGDPGFTLSRGPDTVRAPDVAFVQRARVPDPVPAAFAEFAPDLAVEVLSPHDRPGEALAKIGDWLDAGTRG